jgi:hypothetical protein
LSHTARTDRQRYSQTQKRTVQCRHYSVRMNISQSPKFSVGSTNTAGF